MSLIRKIYCLSIGGIAFSFGSAGISYLLKKDKLEKSIEENKNPWGKDGWEDELVSREFNSGKLFK